MSTSLLTLSRRLPGRVREGQSFPVSVCTAVGYIEQDIVENPIMSNDSLKPANWLQLPDETIISKVNKQEKYLNVFWQKRQSIYPSYLLMCIPNKKLMIHFMIMSIHQFLNFSCNTRFALLVNFLVRSRFSAVTQKINKHIWNKSQRLQLALCTWCSRLRGVL